MQRVFDAAERAGVTIGTDGVTIPVEVADLMPAQCICDGSGYATVEFGGQVIARPKCPACDANG
jgi:hypothetical protein